MNIEDIKVGRDMTTKERLEELVKIWQRRGKAHLERSRHYEQSDILFAYNDARRIGFEECAEDILNILKDLQ